MRRTALTILTVTALMAPSLEAQAPQEASALEARVWLDRGDEPVLRRGETVRIFYRASENAYAAIFRIDTDGRVRLIYPQDPSMANDRLTAGVDYRVIFPNAPVWRVSEDPGVGYLFMVASPEPLDFSAFPFDPEYGWDLGAVGDVVYEDPYLAIDEYVAWLIPDWEVAPYGLDFVTYHVGDTYTYPRFLCYDCHDARPYARWNPYSVQCTTYNVVIYDDPYFYPYYRYSGTALVVARPLVTRPRYAVAARAAGDSFRPVIRTRTPPPRRTAEFKEAPDAGRTGLSSDALTPQRQPTGRPTLQRRPTEPATRLPVRTPPSAGTRATPSTTRGSSEPTIVRPAPRASSPGGTRTPDSPRRPSARVNPTPRGGASPRSTPTARPRAPSRSGAPSTRSGTPSRPTVRPAPSRPSTSTRPSTRPSAPRSSAPRQPSARPPSSSRTPSPSRQPSARANPPSQPSTRPSAPPRSSGSQRPSGNPRSNRPIRR